MSLIQTALNNLILEYPDIFDKDLRNANNGYTQAALSRGNSEIQPLIDGRKSLSQTTKYAFLEDGGILENGARYLLNIADAPANSKLVEVTWATIQASTTLIPSENEGNYISLSKQNAKNLRAVAQSLRNQLELIVATKVQAARSIVASTGSPYPLVGTRSQVPNVDKTDVLNVIDGIMNANGYGSFDMDIIASSMYRAEISRLMENGQYNSVNEALRLNNKNFYFSDAILPSAGVTYDLFTGTEGSYMLGNWNENDAKLNHVGENGKKYLATIPNFPMQVGVYEQNRFIDGTGTVGATATLKNNFSFATDICLVTEVLTDPNDVRAINGFEILNP